MVETESKILDFDKIFNKYIASDAKQKKWMYDRNLSMGASEAFDCLRKAYFKKFGFEADPDFDQSWGAMERGNLIEDYYVVPALEIGLPEGLDLIGAGQADQTTFLDEETRLSATPDGLIAGLPSNALSLYGIDDIESDCVTVEVKSIDPRVSLTEEKAIHRGQVNIQMGLIRDQTDFKPRYAVILYVDASFLDNITPFVVRFDEKTYEAAKVRAKKVFSAKKPEDLAAEGKVTGACKFCPFSSRCNGINLAAVPTESFDKTTSDKDRQAMAKMVFGEQEAKERQKLAEMDVERIRLEMKEFLKKLGTRNLKATDGEWNVTYSTQKGRTGLDREAMEDDGIDLTKYEKVGEGFEVLRVTTKKVK
jgi:hypothetical protein